MNHTYHPPSHLQVEGLIISQLLATGYEKVQGGLGQFSEIFRG